MFPKQYFRISMLILGIVAFALSGCAQLVQPVTTSEPAPTPIVSFEGGGIEDPDVFVDPVDFQTALLQALAARDTKKFQSWMTEPFLTGTWRADLSDTSPANAIKDLYASHLSEEVSLALLPDADLQALMGGKDPLSIPRREAGVIEAYLVSGWGLDGRDEAILFISRQADNSLKWHGWMTVRGGFSGARLGGIQFYQNDMLGFSLYLPAGYQVSQPADGYVAIIAPQAGGHPGGAYLTVEPTGERTTEQVIEAVKTEEGTGFNISVAEVLGIEDAEALVVSGLPGQDVNLQLFMVHDDLLYRILFTPADLQSGDAYWQMQDIYAMVVNTFHFTR